MEMNSQTSQASPQKCQPGKHGWEQRCIHACHETEAGGQGYKAITGKTKQKQSGRGEEKDDRNYCFSLRYRSMVEMCAYMHMALG